VPSVLITGAGRDFGRELLTAFAERSYDTFPLVRNPTVVQELATVYGETCHPIIGDVTQDEVEPAIAGSLERNGRPLDLLINNAGIIRKHRGLAQTSARDIEEHFQVHCTGVLRCFQAALPFLRRASQPRVINITSRWGSLTRTAAGGGCGIYAYQIAKCAQNMLTACLDGELRSAGIRVLAVHPGRLQTSAGAPDADTSPREAAVKLAGWVEQVDSDTACGSHDLMSGGLVEW